MGRIRHGPSEIDDSGFADFLHDYLGQGVHIDGFGPRLHKFQPRRRLIAKQPCLDEEAGLVPAFHQTPFLQFNIRLIHRGNAQPRPGVQLAQGRQAVPRPILAGGDFFLNFIRQGYVLKLCGHVLLRKSVMVGF